MNLFRKPWMSLIALFVALAGVSCPLQANAPDRAEVEVILVRASNANAEVDGSLRAYASTLKRLFRFEGYRRAAGTRLRVSAGATSEAALASGQAVRLRAGRLEAAGLTAEVTWERGGTTLLQTRIQLRPGRPAVLGGPRDGDGTWLLILNLR